MKRRKELYGTGKANQKQVTLRNQQGAATSANNQASPPTKVRTAETIQTTNSNTELISTAPIYHDDIRQHTRQHQVRITDDQS